MMRPTKMKTIGILGGMSNQATSEYYRMINELVNQRLGGWEIGETLIQGLNFGNIEYYVRNGLWDEARTYIEAKAKGAELAGADMLICVSNTMHCVLDNIDSVVSIPFIHISDPTGQAIKNAGLTKVGILGTKPVMQASYIKDRFEKKFGIEVISPNESEQISVDKIIFDELVKGKTSTESKQAYVSVCENLLLKGAQGIILGCTEIFLLLKPEDLPQAPLFNTTELHAKAAVDLALA
ncbi:aspartate/glutamate racemase family protein [Brumicola nitratireducens]|uniref:Aspartate racemase n=1 Tax=Glaciecola nitratireducens (strain JCM 12485 / KCTC 12276 / FR1064) TaxID=1085623 RepID=G4QFP2_GLANF|nr:amino acid racemase [Glaciecola nitratireducens]AEP28827.1 aspartate racemase [Glaciecola nitratireducens FR1064]